MSNYQKTILSGSVDGLPINITGTNSGTANTIHTAHATLLDEPVISAFNSDTVERELIIEWGAAGAGNLIAVTIPPRAAPTRIAPVEGHALLTNSKVVKAYCATTGVISVIGCNHRITSS